MSDKFNNKSEEKDEFDSVDEYEAFMTGVKNFLKNKIPWVILIIFEPLFIMLACCIEKEKADKWIFCGIMYLVAFVYLAYTCGRLERERQRRKFEKERDKRAREKLLSTDEGKIKYASEKLDYVESIAQKHYITPVLHYHIDRRKRYVSEVAELREMMEKREGLDEDFVKRVDKLYDDCKKYQKEMEGCQQIEMSKRATLAKFRETHR